MALKKILASPELGDIARGLGMERKGSKDKWDFTYCELFAGIGGFRIALDDLGGKCVFASEWNGKSQDTYEKNFGERPQGDITKIDPFSIPDHDILTAGFPCQTFSVAGVAKLSSLGREHGMRDPTKGTMFGHTKDIIAAKRPKMFFLENVKNIKYHDKGQTFQIILNALQGLDYEVFTAVQTSVWWVPQHRERMFFIGFDRQRFDSVKFFFPEPPSLKNGRFPMMRDIFDSDADERERARLNDKQWAFLQEYVKRPRKGSKEGRGFNFDLNTETTIARTMLASSAGGSALLIQDDPGRNPRRPTPRECARLMGFPDSFFIPQSLNLSQKQCGNAVVPPLIRHVAKAMFEAADGFLPNPAPLAMDAICNDQIIPPPSPTKDAGKKEEALPAEACCELADLFESSDVSSVRKPEKKEGVSSSWDFLELITER